MHTVRGLSHRHNSQERPRTMPPADDKKIATGRNLPPPAFPVIAGYRFLQTIARSPKSEIHVAHSIELGHNVAIKVLRTGLLSTAGAG